MKRLLTLAACAALLSGCDFVGGAGETVAFSNLTLTASPLPADEDGTPPDLYIEVQDAGGRAIIKSDRVYEDATQDLFPLTISTSGELVGTARTFYLVVMDRDADGYDLIRTSERFTADELRNATDPVFHIEDSRGRVRAELTVVK